MAFWIFSELFLGTFNVLEGLGMYAQSSVSPRREQKGIR